MLSTNILIDLYLEIHATFLKFSIRIVPDFQKQLRAPFRRVQFVHAYSSFHANLESTLCNTAVFGSCFWYLGKLLRELVVAFGVDKAGTDPSRNHCGQDTNEFTARSEGNQQGRRKLRNDPFENKTQLNVPSVGRQGVAATTSFRRCGAKLH